MVWQREREPAALAVGCVVLVGRRDPALTIVEWDEDTIPSPKTEKKTERRRYRI